MPGTAGNEMEAFAVTMTSQVPVMLHVTHSKGAVSSRSGSWAQEIDSVDFCSWHSPNAPLLKASLYVLFWQIRDDAENKGSNVERYHVPV